MISRSKLLRCFVSRYTERLTSPSPHLSLEFREDAAALVLTMKRTEMLNALTPEMATSIADVCRTLAEEGPDSPVRSLVLHGEGRAFCTGRDLKASRSHSPSEAEAYLSAMLSAVHSLYSLPIPTVCGAHGFALGAGMELMMACDIRVVHQKIKMRLPETSIGLFPGAAGIYLLPTVLGNPSVAGDWIMTSRFIPAEEAQKVGFLSRVVEGGEGEEEVLAAALERAKEISLNAPLGVRAAKKMLRLIPESSIFEKNYENLTKSLAEVARQERSFLAQSEDYKEALSAFQEKRRPRFQGK